MSTTHSAGEFIQDELDARGWTRAEFAERIGVNVHRVRGLIKGTAIITPTLAVRIGGAFGTGSTVWLNLAQGGEA